MRAHPGPALVALPPGGPGRALVTEDSHAATVRTEGPGPGAAVWAVQKRGGGFRDRVSLGRTAGNDIAVEDEGVSGVHAYIRLTPDGAAVFDAGSSNGTMVNTALALPGMPTRLRDGDVLSLGGRVRLLYCVPESLWTLARSFGS